MTVTIRHVAIRAGVSEATVSRVLNQQPGVSPQKREKVLAAIRELNFIPNAAARGLRAKGRTGTIGLVVPDITALFFLDIVKGLENILRLNDYRLVICDAQNQPKKERENARWLLNGSVDGLVFLRPLMEDEVLGELAEAGCPIGVFGRRVDHPAITSITVDNRRAGHDVAIHLIGHGHTRIGAIVGPKGVQDAEERFQGFKETLEQHGIALSPEMVECGDFTEEGGARAFRRLLDRGAAPTAIFAANDEMAFGVMHAAREAGFRLPNDLALIGFDNTRLARVVTPSLTTINQPKLEVGFRLAQDMLDRLSGTADVARITLPCDLVVRESCGCHLAPSD